MTTRHYYNSVDFILKNYTYNTNRLSPKVSKNYYRYFLLPFLFVTHIMISQEQKSNSTLLSSWHTVTRCLKPSSSPSDAPLTCAQKTKKTIFNCCMPKISKLACAYCCCGKSFTETIQSFGEYKLCQAVYPLLQNHYCYGGTIATCGCILCVGSLYKIWTIHKTKNNTDHCTPPPMLYDDENDEL